mgnify:FL=1|jgi:hypothetical protein|tara:strand:+ start:288 stop:515 length:228 start_codon:yes stop_codon:yes gene_type:complete
MYRIVREENHLANTVRYIIERRKTWLWMESWTRQLGLDIPQNGPVGASYYDGALHKLNRIKVNNGQMIRKGVVVK